MTQAITAQGSMHGFIMVTGTGTMSTGTLAVVTGLSTVKYFSFSYVSTPGASSLPSWSASGGTVTAVDANSNNVAFTWAAWGYR